MTDTLQNSLINLFSINRLDSYKYAADDTDYTVIERYLYNIEISKSLYPLLSILEVSLRNRLNQAIETTVKSDWLLNELQQQDILRNNEYNKLLAAKQKLIKKEHVTISKDDLIAELSLGFWIHLCTKYYKRVRKNPKNDMRKQERLCLSFPLIF